MVGRFQKCDYCMRITVYHAGDCYTGDYYTGGYTGDYTAYSYC